MRRRRKKQEKEETRKGRKENIIKENKGKEREIDENI